MPRSVILLVFILLASVAAQNQDLNTRVKTFLDEHKGEWHNLNIPYADGQSLYDLIVKNNYTRALEIGTSTGHSGIWIAWALSKTGGKLITIEINQERYEQALKNFEEAGVSEYIDARLADAHELVPKLKGPFDFVFSDADKTWYKKYLQLLMPKLEVGGCFTAHNVLNTYMPGMQDFLNYLDSLPNMHTKIIHSSSSGISVSCKTGDSKKRAK
jgi:caffeoyl-CoA O-methyltransferase